MIDYNSVYQKDYFQSRPQLDDINNRGHYYEYSNGLSRISNSRQSLMLAVDIPAYCSDSMLMVSVSLG